MASDLTRFEMLLPKPQRSDLSALAEAAGVPAATLARMGINWVLARRDLLLTGSTTNLDGALDHFVSELCADVRTAKAADQVAGALATMDIEADGNPDAVALLQAMSRIAGADWPLEHRLAALFKLTSAPTTSGTNRRGQNV